MVDARATLDQLIRERGEDMASLSRLLGRNAAYIQQFIRRGVPRKLDEADRATLARYFGIGEVALGGPVRATDAPVSVGGRRDRHALIRIPRLAVGASAGPGAINDDDRLAGWLAIDRTVLRALSSSPDAVAMIKVTGDSMAPTLGDGDDILVDGADGAERLRDGIYVLRLDDALNVKRIARSPDGRRITIASDNSAYPSWPDCDPERFVIIGRVIWTGRRVA